MSITARKIAFPDTTDTILSKESSPALKQNVLNLASHLEVECLVQIGTLSLSIGELQKLKTGQILSLRESIYDSLELIINQKTIARGELMCHEHHFALHLTEVFT